MNAHLAWYLARATGYVAWGLLSASLVLGLLLSTKLAKGHLTPAWILDLHRFLGGTSVLFTAVHVAGVIADNNVHFGLLDVLVPFVSSWRPFAVALGVIAMYMLVAVETTSLLMKRLPRRLWRRIHLASYFLFWIATFHLLMAGTDSSAPTSRTIVAVVIALVVFLTLVRVLIPRRVPASRAIPTASRSEG